MRFTRWDQELSTVESNEVLLHLAQWHVSESIGTKQSAEIQALLDAEDFYGLCHYDLELSGLTIHQYRNLRQVLAFFQKRHDLDLGIDTAAVALGKAIEAEEKCRQTNEIFRKYNQGGFFFPLDVERVLFHAQRKIASILGDLPSLSALKLRFGPGATTTVKKKDASARRKLSQMYNCSEEALRFFPELCAEMPDWSGFNPESSCISSPVGIHPCRIDFVRKTAKTDRSIAVEPMLNSMVQLGIGDYMADRLRRSGVDIQDQTRNQRLALLGSTSNALATLDLSSASDTVASGLVESLLPLEWWDFLRSFRSGVALFPDGSERRLQKFSSMGNGFTFPLETLIFFALAYACALETASTEWVSVYGDDIIVTVETYPLITKTLTCVGFEVNKSKSFFDGPFRESCGKDYYSGVDVRPCYIKGPLSGDKCFVLHNFYVRSGQPELASEVLKFVDESLRIWGPDGFGDGHLVRSSTKDLSPAHRDRGWGGFCFETYTWKARKAFYSLGADYVFPQYSIYMKEGFLDLPDALAGLRRDLVGTLRPERVDSFYAADHRGKVSLQDTLPGREGYKRIKIYTFG